MKLLLDTHIFLWYISGDQRLILTLMTVDSMLRDYPAKFLT